MKINFQFFVLIGCIVAAIFGMLVFSGAIPIGRSGSSNLGTVVLWGTVPQGEISASLQEFNNANPSFVVKYVQKSADTFDQDLLEALASGTGPDMFFLPDNLILHYANKIVTIPYTSYPISTFKNTFAGAGEVFLTSGGILAFPMSIDPLMMYYNRSIFDSNGVIYPPVTWDDVTNLSGTLTKKDNSNQISQSEIAFGGFSNITNAKDILATLFMQAGNPIIREDSGTFISVLSSQPTTPDLSSILKFYTDFADPNSPVYSWNKSLPNSDDAFSAGNLALYFGYASELQTLVNKNPNENFFIAPVPQLKNSSIKLTGARVTGLAVSSSSKYFNTAFKAASLMATGSFASEFATDTGTAPARRDLLASVPSDAYSPIFYSSALYAKSWLDPSPTDTDTIFSGMVDNVISGNMSTMNAIKDADSKMSLLLLK